MQITQCNQIAIKLPSAAKKQNSIGAKLFQLQLKKSSQQHLQDFVNLKMYHNQYFDCLYVSINFASTFFHFQSLITIELAGSALFDSFLALNKG